MNVGHAQHGPAWSALKVYEEAQHAISPPTYIYPSTLKACGDLIDLRHGRVIHDHVVRHGLEMDVVIGSSLIDMYCKCRSLYEAHTLFNRLPTRNIFTWGALIAGYAQHDYGLSASQLFARMMLEGIRPNKVTLLSALKACGSSGSLQEGRLLHDMAIKGGFEGDLAIGNTLVVVYSKGGSMEEADSVFGTLKGRNAVSWCVMMTSYMQRDQTLCALELFTKMQSDGVKPNNFVFSSILKVCGTIGAWKEAISIHDQIFRNYVDTDTVVGTNLIDMYATCGLLCEALFVFNRLKSRNVVSWNVMICGYGHHGECLCALKLFGRMNFEAIQPNKATYLYVMQVCGDSVAIIDGKILHVHLCESGVEIDPVIGSSLIDMYIKCGSLEEACDTFDRSCKQNVVLWSAIISGHSCHGDGLRALELFEQMQGVGIEPDKVTFLCVLKAIGALGMVEQGTVVHDSIVLLGLESDVMIANSLMHMYCNCGNLRCMCHVFERMSSCRDAVSWTAVIIGHAIHGRVPAAFRFFSQMQQEGMRPDKVTVLYVLKACGLIGAFEQGKLIHEYILQNGTDSEVTVGNTLVDMYARCGSIEDASTVFNNLHAADIVSWGAMISGYAEHGCFSQALECLEKMHKQGLKPNPIMFTSILSACGRAGHMKIGHQYFQLMTDRYGIMPSFEHVNCMADLFGHGGCLEEATRLLRSMPGQPDLTGWMSLLTACKTHGNRDIGQQSYHKIWQEDSSFAGGYAFMADIVSAEQDAEVVQRLQELRAATKAWKVPGRTWMETSNDLHEFVVGDTTHPSYDEIHAKLQSLKGLLNEEGYFSQLDSIVDITIEEKETHCCSNHPRPVDRATTRSDLCNEGGSCSSFERMTDTLCFTLPPKTVLAV